jgi:hypothetical protein
LINPVDVFSFLGGRSRSLYRLVHDCPKSNDYFNGFHWELYFVHIGTWLPKVQWLL